MSVIKGYNGSVKVGTTPTVVGEAQSFSIDVGTSISPTTALGNDGWETNIGLLKNWSVTVTANFDYDDAGQGILVVGDTVAVELYVGGTATGNKKYSGDIIVESAPISNDVGGLVTVSFTGKGTGALTSEIIA